LSNSFGAHSTTDEVLVGVDLAGKRVLVTGVSSGLGVETARRQTALLDKGTIRAFLRGLNLVFQRGKSEGLSAIYHFTFTGQEEVKATVVIHDKKVDVSDGHNGTPDFQLTADSSTWVRFLRKEANLVWALLTRKIRIHGSPRLLLAFARCFPS